MFSTAQNNAQPTHPLTSGMHNSKHHAYMPKTDILNTCCILICIYNQGISIRRGYLL